MKWLYEFRNIWMGDFVISGILLIPQSQIYVLKLLWCMGAATDSANLGVLSQI